VGVGVGEAPGVAVAEAVGAALADAKALTDADADADADAGAEGFVVGEGVAWLPTAGVADDCGPRATGRLVVCGRAAKKRGGRLKVGTRSQNGA